MKKVSITLLAVIIALSASAKLDGDGYYRVQNYKTERYIYVLDDKGKLNFQATTAELNALQLWKGYEKTISDPATIIYVQDLTGKNQDFDLQAQGTGVKAIIDFPVSIRLADKVNETYSIFGRNSGMTKYIGDGTAGTADRGKPSSLNNGENYRWYFHPLTTEDSNYFGINADLSDGTTNYAAFYADFPFSFHTAGMKAYTIVAVANGKAHLQEINGTVPRATPVIITAASEKASDNRLSIGGEATTVNGNMLKGVYFNNTELNHQNQTAYDKKTMRVLGKLSDGSIGFKTEDIDFLPRNKAYLVVPEGTPDELHLTTEAAGIADAVMTKAAVRADGLSLYISGVNTAEVYNITGRCVARVSDASLGATVSLPAPGLYLVKAGTIVTKVLAK